MTKYIVFVWPGEDIKEMNHYLYDNIDDLLSAIHDLVVNRTKYSIFRIGECLADKS